MQGIHAKGDIGTTLGVNPKLLDAVKDVGVKSLPESDPSKLVIAPYQCASCHGSNGAPKGHGETAACFWCHSEDFTPKNHGSASTYTKKTFIGGDNPNIHYRTFKSIDVDSTDKNAVDALQSELRQDLYPEMKLGIYPGKKGIKWQGYWGKYSDDKDMKVRTNSSWSTDPAYPDPYSCMTCHPNN